MFHNKKSKIPFSSYDAKSASDKKTKKIKHSSSKKQHSKYNRGKKAYSKICNSNFRHSNSASNYVGRERLTNRVGFFTKGKISDSITRFEKNMPDEIKARAEQDLQQVLKLTNGVKKKTDHILRKKCSHESRSMPSVSGSSCKSLYTPPSVHSVDGFAGELWKQKLKSVGSCVENSVLSSVCKPPQENPISKTNELLASSETILKKLHPPIAIANKKLFPNKRNEENIISELKLIKDQYNSTKVINPDRISSSYSTLESSQPISDDEKSLKENFTLNPVLTEQKNVVTDIKKIFPSVSDSSVESDEDDDIEMSSKDEEDSCSIQDHLFTSYDTLISKQTSCSGNETSFVSLVPCSPSSIEGSPTWKLQLSPVKFVPEFPPTPKFYFRQKMF